MNQLFSRQKKWYSHEQLLELQQKDLNSETENSVEVESFSTADAIRKMATPSSADKNVLKKIKIKSNKK